MNAPVAQPVLAAPKRFEKAFSEDEQARVRLLMNQLGNRMKSNSSATPTRSCTSRAAQARANKPEVYECGGELSETAPLIYDAWLTVRDKIFAGHRLVRCYANAMAYGMDGTVHTDSSDPGNYTAVYYPHERWSPNWGGETMFYNREESRIVGCFYPRPNSVVVFDGRIPHRANGVTRSYAGMRITLMFKTEKPDAV